MTGVATDMRRCTLRGSSTKFTTWGIAIPCVSRARIWPATAQRIIRHTYGKISEVDVVTWERETLKFVTEGSSIFHSGDALGSEIAVSCDMCHPDASNTHPETYPKFQVQLGRVALLRDMINWCIEHPVRGKVLEPDSAQMRALEAYIFAQRKGKELAYGKR